MRSGDRGRDRQAPLQSVVAQFADILGADRIALLRGEARLRRHWPEIVGVMLAARSRLLELEPLGDGSCCMWVAVDHPYLAQQLRLMRDALRQACRRYSGVVRIAKIRSRIEVGAGRAYQSPAATKVVVSWHMRRMAAQELRPVADRALRRAMYRARVCQLASAEAVG
ncbi:MAG: DUF721 domain-containing protein [Mariprofundales bacterium]|nr:DUF721 domain-containing protein [Mariprofundales bacterium]